MKGWDAGTEGGGGLGGHKEEPWGQHVRRHGGSQVFG